MSQIKISVPNDDHVALRAMAKALEEIAVARGAPAQSVSLENHIHISQDESWLKQQVTEAMQKAESGEAVYLSSEEAEAKMDNFKEEIREKYDPAVSQTPITDSTGTPWDERIHSASKALNSDGTWRLRRKPKDMDEAEWLAYVDAVQTYITSDEEDLERLFPSGFDVNYKANFEEVIEPPVTPEGDDFHGGAGEVTEQEVASIQAPPPPPVPNAATIAAMEELESGKGESADEYVNYTFPQVMQFLTEHHGRITSPQVDQIIADMGLNSIMDIRDNPEHAGPFIARVKALLGEWVI